MDDSLATTYVLLALSIVCSSASQIFQKLASTDLKSHSGATLFLVFNSNIMLSILFLGAGLILWLLVISKMELSVAYPIVSMSYILVMLSAKVFFHEIIPVRRWIGALLIVAGTIVLVGN